MWGTDGTHFYTEREDSRARLARGPMFRRRVTAQVGPVFYGHLECLARVFEPIPRSTSPVLWTRTRICDFRLCTMAYQPRLWSTCVNDTTTHFDQRTRRVGLF